MYNSGEVVLIPVPFTELSTTKRRPVLIISNNNYNSSKPDIVVAAVTSNILQPGVLLSNNDMETGTLPKQSIIRFDKIYTLDQSIVIKSIGHVTNAILDSVRTEIIDLIS